MPKYKPIFQAEAVQLGLQLRSARITKGLRLEDAAHACSVNVGQLSRFERGDFKMISPNLQIYSDYLQIRLAEPDELLIDRFRNLIMRSPNHHHACELIINALDELSKD